MFTVTGKSYFLILKRPVNTIIKLFIFLAKMTIYIIVGDVLRGGATHDKVLQDKAIPYKRTGAVNVETRWQLPIYMELDVSETAGALQAG